METKVLVLEDYKKTGKISAADLEKIGEAAEVLKRGGLVAFPTETVYGLGGDGRRGDVSARIYAAKGRPSDNPLIVHISSMEELPPLVKDIPETCRKLADAYWPGPMTLVLNKSAEIPKETTGGLDTLAVRMPVHPVANKLIELSGVPVAAPSANRSGRPSTTTAEHCIEDLDGRIDLILDGGPCDIGVESTIVDLTEADPVLLRPGAVTVEMLTKTLGKEPAKDKAVLRALTEGEKPKAPGMKYRHYAPQAPLTVIRAKQQAETFPPCRNQSTGTFPPCRNQSIGTLLPDRNEKAETLPLEYNEKVYARILALAGQNVKDGLRTEIICTQECADWLREQENALAGPGKTETYGTEEIPAAEVLKNVPLRILGSASESLKISRSLFAVLRDTDEDKVDRLIAEGFGENDLFLAIMNRLKKAAGWQIEEV